MYNTVGTKEGKNVCDETNKKGCTSIVAAKSKVGGKDTFGVTVQGEVNESNENGKEANHM